MITTRELSGEPGQAPSGKFKGLTVTGGTNIPSYSNYFTDGTGNEVSQSQQLTVTLNGSNTYYNYAYDSDGRLKSDTPYPTTAASTYSASTAMGQTCSATPSGDVDYDSDKAGNNLGPTGGPIHYNAQQQVDSISSPGGAGPVAQSYLDQGNNLRLAAGNLSYTQGSKLGVTAQSVTGSGSSTTFYTRDPNGQILDEHGASGTYYYETDRLGSTMTLIDTSGHNAGSYTYDPYGKTTVINGTSSTAAAANPWRYTGGYQDVTDGYYHLGARYYDAAGHFTQADSVGGSLLRPEKYDGYAYAAGDPINATDLSGQLPTELLIKILTAVLQGKDLFTALNNQDSQELFAFVTGSLAEFACDVLVTTSAVATAGLTIPGLFICIAVGVAVDAAVNQAPA